MRAALVLLLTLTACGAARPSAGRTPEPERSLRELARGPTTHSGFHGATRVLSLGATGFVAADPSHAWFFAWDGARLGEVELPPRASLVGVTSDERAVFVELVGPAGSPAPAVVSRLGDGSRVVLSGFDPPTVFGASLAPGGTSVAGIAAEGIVLSSPTGAARRVLLPLRAPTRAALAWSPEADGMAVVDRQEGATFRLFVVLPSGRRSSTLLAGDLGDDPGAAVAWRGPHEIVVRRGGGAYHASQIVDLALGTSAGPRVLLDVPGSVSSIAAHEGDLALVSVRSHRTLQLAHVDALGAWSEDAPVAEGTYLRPLGVLPDGSVVFVEREEDGGAWRFRATRAGETRELGRLNEVAEVAATTDANGSVLVVCDRPAPPALVDLATDTVIAVSPDVVGRLRVADAIACTPRRCVVRSRPPSAEGVWLSTFDRTTGALDGASCVLEGRFPEPTGLSISEDGERAAFAGTLDAPHDGAIPALDAATVVELATCAQRVLPVPGRFVQYAAFAGADLIVSGSELDSTRWGLWRLSAGAIQPLFVGDDRVNRPVVTSDGAVLFGRQHVEAAVYLWSR